MPLLVATALTKDYPMNGEVVHALRGVSLTVAPGDYVAIVGPSGCGKSTLLQLLGGIDTPSAGSVALEGTRLESLGDSALTRLRLTRLGFVFQSFHLIPVLTAAENVELPLIVSGTRPKVAREMALQALDRVRLRDKANQRPSQLSGGQRQRITVARAVVNRPAIMWADEPTGALDSATATEIMDLIVELNQSANQTCVIVTHDPKVAARCHRTIHMADGVIVREDSQATMREVAGSHA